jgi:hypothetical protein
MRGVVVGGQRRREQLTCAVADLAEECGFGIVALPVSRDGDAGTVGQAETGDVDRVGGRVFAPVARMAAGDAAATIAAEMIDRRDACA